MEPSENSNQKPEPAPAQVSFYEKHKKVYIHNIKDWWNN
jgi:hypothetical protein